MVNRTRLKRIHIGILNKRQREIKGRGVMAGDVRVGGRVIGHRLRLVKGQARSKRTAVGVCFGMSLKHEPEKLEYLRGTADTFDCVGSR